MTDFTTTTCFGCGTAVTPSPGNFYCGKCIAAQEKQQESEREGFELMHSYADAILKRTDRA